MLSRLTLHASPDAPSASRCHLTGASALAHLRAHISSSSHLKTNHATTATQPLVALLSHRKRNATQRNSHIARARAMMDGRGNRTSTGKKEREKRKEREERMNCLYKIFSRYAGIGYGYMDIYVSQRKKTYKNKTTPRSMIFEIKAFFSFI